MWDCNYGLYPLNDAPYTAAYEEQEVFCALHDYLTHAEGVEILPSVRLLLAKFIRYTVDRAVYYYSTVSFKVAKEKSVSFRVAGDARLECRLMLVKTGINKLPEVEVSTKGRKDPLSGKPAAGGNLEFKLPGDCQVSIKIKR